MEVFRTPGTNGQRPASLFPECAICADRISVTLHTGYFSKTPVIFEKAWKIRVFPQHASAATRDFGYICIFVTSQLGYIAFRLPSELWFCAWFRPGMVFTVPGPNAKTQFGYVTNSVEMFVQRTKNRNLSKQILGAPRRCIF